MSTNRTKITHGCLFTILAGAAGLHAQDAPKVTELTPANESMEVDAAKTTRLTVKFDQDMDTRGRSICGGGPTFPRIAGKITWPDKRTMIVPVKLVPGHTYRMSLNCQSFRNFRSAAGKTLTPTAWSFTTLPKILRPIKEQKALNAKALGALQKILASSYSYYDLRQIDWKKLYREHRDPILACRTDAAWASAVATMLRPTQDLHLYLRVDGQIFATGSRRIDSLFRGKHLQKYLTGLAQPIQGVITGKTKGGIAYIMISSWTSKIDKDLLDVVMQKVFKNESVKALIVDVRPNSGGDEIMARRIASRFVKGTKVYAKNVYRTGKGNKGFGPALARRIQGCKDEDRFGRPVAVLMSRYCMSSNEAFLLMMKQAEKCTLVGQTSFGSSGNPKPHELPNGVTVFVPSWKALLPDGTCFEGQGIAPDVEVVPDEKDLRTSDPILEKAIDVLHEKS